MSRISNVSSILWSYTFNRALKFKTVSFITDILFEQLNPTLEEINLLSFELINIITFYYSLPLKSFPESLVIKIKGLCVGYFERMYM